jgi:hypothetical protein
MPMRPLRLAIVIALVAGFSLAGLAGAFAQVRPFTQTGPAATAPIVTAPVVTTPVVTVPAVTGPAATGPAAPGPSFAPADTSRLTPSLAGRPRLPPAEIDIPSGVRPYGPVVIDNLDAYRQRLITGRWRRVRVMRPCTFLQIRRADIHCGTPAQVRQIKPIKPTRQPAQITRRGGFDAPPPGETRFVPNEVLLNIAASVPAAGLRALARLHHLTRLESQDFTLTGRRLFRWRIDDGRPVPVVIRSLRADPRILSAQPNYLFALQEDAAGPVATPDAPHAQADSAQYALAKLHLTEAHALATGDGVLVAVIDTPIDAAHPDLAGAIAATFDATGAAEKPLAHGTAMASAIAAHGKLTGSAPRVKLLSVQAFGRVRSRGTSFDILKGLQWAADQNANIINMSFAGPSDPELQMQLAAVHRKGIVLIAAAGNAGPNSRPLYPAADPNVIAVTATDVDDKLFERANRGGYIAVAAPGVNVLVAAPDGSYGMTSGTSVAAAEVSGVAALLIERNRKLDPASVRQLLTSTAHRLGAAGAEDQFGAGLTDAFGALTALDGKPASATR